MFNDAMIVQSAVSAFNNAALLAPAFLWWAILAAPIYVMAWMFGGAFVTRMGWNKSVLNTRAAMVAVVMAVCWVVLFGGNYGVLRDGATLLPFMTAAILFVSTLFIGSHLRNVTLPVWREMSRGMRIMWALGVFIALAMVARSGVHAWWGPLLQVAAVVFGLVVGRAARAEMRSVPGAILVMMATTTAILMQPEYFRFGQLGNLTVVHLLFVMLVGAACAATVALRNINARNRIHRSAYIKLKWMARFVSILGVALFFLTESVPVFLGTTLVLFVSFAMSVWHAKTLAARSGDAMFAFAIMMFGVITAMPAVTAMGVVCLADVGHVDIRRDFGFLL